MVARSVMRAWQESLAASPPIDRLGQPEMHEAVRSSPGGWQAPVAQKPVQIPANDDVDEDPSIQVDKRDDIVPRRPGAASGSASDESFWSSHHFWKGIVVGAVTVLLVKTIIAIQAPIGVDWYGF